MSDLEINNLSENLTDLTLEDEDIPIIIQKNYRGHLIRRKRLPNKLLIIQLYLSNIDFTLCSSSDDGRINSCSDETIIIDILINKFPDIKKADTRMWYDILVKDYKYGWLPVNIKTTTTETSDNTANLAMCVYAYTDEDLDLEKKYNGGPMSKILIKNLSENKINYKSKKDYYFLVVNKNNTNEVIINSCKGLSKLIPNNNNLPFQVNWSNNKEYNFINIKESIKKLITCLQKPSPSWHEIFLQNIRNITI
tara:strand:- start:3188 stop:3940 length:753 start_codon:yes stop_codon:yes gene_type:complete